MHPKVRRDLACLGQLDHVQRRWLLGLSVLEAVFSINGGSIEIGEQPALCLGEMQVDGPRLASGSQQLPDFVHLDARLVLRWKLLQRDKCRCQGFRDDPWIVAGDSLSWHSPSPQLCQSEIPSRHNHRSERYSVTRRLPYQQPALASPPLNQPSVHFAVNQSRQLWPPEY
jgi:hypothetical protein